MILNQGKRNKQAVQVLNKIEYDSEGNPVGMMEDPSNPASANFGTPREPRRGGCYKGDGSAYITITGLLSTDTVEVFDGSDMPTISDDRLDIASGNRIFGVRILRAGELWAKYNCSENSGDICYDSSGNGNHGTIINAITTTPEKNPNSIHQYQDIYSFENEEGYSDADLYRYSNDYSITNVQSVTKISEGSKLVFSVPYRTIHRVPAVTIGKTNNFNTFSRERGIKYRVRFTIKADTNTPSVYPFSIRAAGYPAGYTLSNSGKIPILTANTPVSIDTILTDNGSNLGWIIRDIGFRFDNVVVTPYDIIYEISNLTVEVYSSRIIPRNESISIPPFKDVLGNNLQCVGKVPGKAKFVESSCLLSDGNAYLSGDVLTTDTITAHPESEVPVCTTDGRLDFPNVNGKYFDITIERDGNVIARLPLCEPIIDPSNHIYHDVSGNGNHASLVNGTLANEGKQDKFHYFQRGFNYYENRFKYSEDLSNAFWAKRFLTVTYNQPDPEGGNGAVLISRTHTIDCELKTSNGSYGGESIYNVPSYCSVYAKSNTGAYMYVRNFAGAIVAYFDLVNNTVKYSSARGEAKITDTGNGWKFCELKSFNGGGDNYHLFSIGVAASDNSMVGGTGDESIYIYKPHLAKLDINKYIKTTDRVVLGMRKPTTINDPEYDVDNELILHTQDSHSFLNTGTELEAYDYPALRQADKNDDFWNEDDGLGTVAPKPVQFDSLITQKGLSDKLFLDSSVSETIKNVRMYGSDLKGRQLNTENKLTNNV